MTQITSTLAWKLPWTEVRDIVQEAVIKTQEKEIQKGKMVV